MAARASEIVAIGEAVALVSEVMRQAKYLADQVLANNSAHAVDWNLRSTQDALDSAGKPYTGREISNAIGSLAKFRDDFWNGTPPAGNQGGNGGNFELLSRPLV